MPPTLFLILATPMTKLAHTIFPPAIANGVISGAFVFCELLVYVCDLAPLISKYQMSYMTACIMRMFPFFLPFRYINVEFH